MDIVSCFRTYIYIYIHKFNILNLSIIVLFAIIHLIQASKHFKTAFTYFLNKSHIKRFPFSIQGSTETR